MAIRKTFQFSTVVWGPWHTGVFLDVNLTSLLAPGNLAAFAQKHDVSYRIFTSKNDDARIAGAMILLIPPDVVWSNGAFGHIADIAALGKKAIFMTYMRVVSET